MERRKSRGQSANSGGYADRDIEDVVIVRAAAARRLAI
jgi:hypothetical protein